MNKKFLSAILFGALMVTSTGTFVSCKDYDDDIDNLQGQIDKLVTPETLSAQIAQLQANIDAAKQSASSELATAKAALEAAIAGKADTAVITSLTEKVTAAQTKVDNLEDKLGTIESTLNSVKSDVDNLKQNAGKVEMAEIDRRIKELRNELLAIIGDKLSSLVFVPALYENGIEAARYPYAQGIYKAFTGKSEGNNAEGAKFTIAEKNTFINVADGGDYTISSLAKAVYHVNPTTANLTNVAWGFLYSEPEYVDASARAAVTPKPVYSTSRQLANGDLEVVYKVENPAELKIVADKNVSVMALTGTYQNEEAKDTTVTSDYAAILPAVVTFKAIAFNTLETENNACALGAKQHELYIKGEDAAKKDATIDVKYNGGTLDLTQYLNVHYTQADIKAAGDDAEHQIMAYADVADYGLHFEYEMLGYKTGANNTEENKYGTVNNNGIFTPCYVNANGNTTPCSTNEDGISAVGRTPIVLVKLMDGENIVLAGYVKLHIVKDLGIQTLPEVFNATKPYVCDGFEDGITWDDMSGKIIEALKMTKAEFVNSFNFVAGKTYITNDSQKTFAEVENNVYGELTISSDFTNVTTTNDIITWTADFDEMDAISKLEGRTVTLYACFQSKTDTKFFVYVPFTVTIAKQPEVTFGDKIKAYWYPTTESTVAKRDTVRMNVPSPAASDKTVKDYYKDLDDNFEGNVVKVAKTSATQNQYYDLEVLGTACSYEFAATQPEIADPNQNGVKYQLVRGTDHTKLYVGTADVEGNLVASIAADGTLTYAATDSAKKLLNLYGHLIPKHFANVEIVATYDECQLALGTENFKVRFLRPVDVLDGDQAKFIDAQANGSSIVLGDLFDLKDWREGALIVKNTAGVYESAVENGVSLYPYYEFKTIKVDIANAECNLTGTRKKVSEVTDKLQLSVTENGAESATNIVNITEVAALNTTKIVYKNNEGNVQKFTLWIPVEITYYWGTLKAVAKCDVESTKANQ